MSKLEDLYEGKKRLERAGYKLTAEQLQDLDGLEEELIKTEVLPTLSKDIEPRLSKIQRDLVLVVEYHPGESISVALSRKKNITELLDAKRIEIDPEVEHSTTGAQQKKKTNIAEDTNLRVVFEGQTYENEKAVTTFVDVLKRIGLTRVRTLGITWCKIPLVSTTKDAKYNQKHEGEFYVMVNSSTHQKKKHLDDVAKGLGLTLHVDVIDKDGNVVPPEERKRRRKKDIKEKSPKQKKEQASVPEDDNTLLGRYKRFLHQNLQDGAARWYARVLDNQVKTYIKKLIDSETNGVYDYKTADEVRLCIELLKESDEFMTENKKMRNVMTATLNKYYQFMQEEEQTNK